MRGKSNPKNRIGSAKAELKNKNSEKVLANSKTIIPVKVERKEKPKKKLNILLKVLSYRFYFL